MRTFARRYTVSTRTYLASPAGAGTREGCLREQRAYGRGLIGPSSTPPGPVGGRVPRARVGSGRGMRIAIAGAHGQVALLLGRRLSEAGDTVVGLIRSAEQQDDLRAAGVEPALVDLE